MHVAKVSPPLCEFVAVGHGVALAYPLMMKEVQRRLVFRPFERVMPLDFRLCRSGNRTHMVAGLRGCDARDGVPRN